MTDATTGSDPLAALGAHLGARGLSVELLASGLRVVNEQVRGRCEDVPHPSDLITCRPRRDDGGRMWFFTSWGAPLAEADRVIDASMAILGNLAGRPATSGIER